MEWWYNGTMVENTENQDTRQVVDSAVQMVDEKYGDVIERLAET